MTNKSELDEWEETDKLETPPPPIQPNMPPPNIKTDSTQGKPATKIRILKRTSNNTTAVGKQADQAPPILRKTQEELDALDAEYEKSKLDLEKEVASNLSELLNDSEHAHHESANTESGSDPGYNPANMQSTVYRPYAYSHDSTGYWDGQRSTDMHGNMTVTFQSFYPPLYPPTSSNFSAPRGSVCDLQPEPGDREEPDSTK